MAIPSPVGELKIVFSVSTVGAKYIDTQIKFFFYLLSHDSHLVVDHNLPIPVGVFPGLLGQCISVTYPRRTAGTT